MKPLLYLIALTFTVLGGTACSRGGEATMQNPRNYKSVSTNGTRRDNDRRQYKQTRGGSVGLGLDTKANNPYQFRTVKGSKNTNTAKGANNAPCISAHCTARQMDLAGRAIIDRLRMPAPSSTGYQSPLVRTNPALIENFYFGGQ